MQLPRQRLIPFARKAPARSYANTANGRPHRLPKKNEWSMADAQHRPSLGGPSFGHLISELSATTPQMTRDGFRIEGQTMSEEHRTLGRRVAQLLIGVPLAIGTVWVGTMWFRKGSDDSKVQ